jgi:flagellar hook-basal body complex protein FliE
VIIPAIGVGPLGPSEWSVGSIGDLGTSVAGVSPAAAASTASTSAVSGSFGGSLTNAISSLEKTQDTATTDSEKLATGQLSNPTTAVTAVENATIAMDFASQIRNQIDSATTTLFSTQM